MLWVVAPYVAEMLHLKSLTINRVAGVAGFQTIPTCKYKLKTLKINMIACVFGGFLSKVPFTPNIIQGPFLSMPTPTVFRSFSGGVGDDNYSFPNSNGRLPRGSRDSRSFAFIRFLDLAAASHGMIPQDLMDDNPTSAI